MTRLMDLKMSHSWQHVNHETWREIINNDITPPQRMRHERIAVRNARWRILELLKTNMCWAPCLILSIAWQIITSRDMLKNNWRMEWILDEPPCRTSMKNSGNKMMIKRKKSWKHKVKPCNDLDGSPWCYNWESLEFREKKR